MKLEITRTAVWHIPNVDYPPYEVVAYTQLQERVYGPHHISLHLDLEQAEKAAREALGQKISMLEIPSANMYADTEVVACFQ